MAGTGRSWAKPLSVTALFAVAAIAAVAQSAQSGSLAGRLTDLYSAPLEGATVVLRNQATGAEARATTARNGSYRFIGLDAGEYTLEAESPQLGHGRLDGILVTAGHEARVQAAMKFEPLSPESLLAAWCNMERPDLGPVALPFPDSDLATEPLRTLALRGQRLVDLFGGMPEAESLVMTATLAAESLHTLPLTGEHLPDFVRQTPLAAGRDLTMTAVATGIVQAAMQIAEQARMLVRVEPQGIDPVTPAVTTTVTAAELQSLPASGRRWQEFVLDTPTAAAQAGGQGPASLRGAQQPAEITIDGSSNRLAFGGAGSPGQGASEPDGMGRPWAGRRSLAVSEAAIREVETAAGNVEAEGARAAGGRMNVETQHGANGLHGQGFLFDRQNTWGARNPFTQWVTETSEFAPLAPFNTALFPVFDNFQYSSGQSGPPESYTPPDHEMVWGIGAGSQLRRDKLFWFAALDGYNRNDAGLSMVKHPYLLQPEPSNTCANPPCTETTGFFALPSDDQMNVLCARMGLMMLGYQYACPNGIAQGLAIYSPMLETLAGLLGPAPRTATQWTGFGRLDWQATERHRFTLEGIGARWNSPGGGLTRVSETYGNHSFGSSKASEEWLLDRWEAFLTPNLLAVTQASAGRTIQEARPSTPSAFEQTFLAGNAYGQLPQIVVDNRYGFTIGNPSRFGQGSYPDERLYQGQESVDWVRGSLLVKAGFELNHNSDATSLLRNQTGTYTYSNVENFISDALAFQKFGISGELDPVNWHNCDQTGTVWHDSGGGLNGGGSLPCYSYYSQTIGPSDWHLSTNDWAGFATAQWQAGKLFVISAGLRWEREQLPPPIAALANPELPLTAKLPSLGNNWGPRVSMALGSGKGRWPVLRLGYGMYFGRTENSTLMTALTQTGSLVLTPAGSPAGDLKIFIRPTDGFSSATDTSEAPPFPYVLRGLPGSVVKPGAVEFAPNFRNPEVHQAVTAVEETLPGHVEVTASAMVSLGRRLPISIDTNIDLTGSPQPMIFGVTPNSGPTSGPIQTAQITVPIFYSARINPDYQEIDQITSKANSTYEAAMLKVVRYGRRGLSLHAHYTYAHATDWNPNEIPMSPDPANFRQEYGTSDLDQRHSAAAMVIYEAPWKLHNLAGKLGNGWMVSGIGNFHSGLPYTMRVTGSLAAEFTTSGTHIMGLRPGMNGSGGDNRVYWEDSDNLIHTVGRNTYRYPATWKADLRLGKRFDLGKTRQLELLAESFNLFNHQNVTELETTGYYIGSGTPSSLPTLNFLTGPVLEANGTIKKPNTTAFGQPLSINATNFYRERQIQFGLRLRF
jgi:hypothetical protein